MKKCRIKLIALFVVVSLVLPGFTNAGALVENEVDDGLTLEEIKEIGRREAPATRAFLSIMHVWENEDGVLCYPESYGGCFLDENYNLVIKIKGNDEKLKNDILSIADDTNSIVFRETDISFNELLDLKDAVLSEIPQGVCASANIVSRESAVHVTFWGDNENKNWYNECGLTDSSSHVVFECSSGITECLSLNPGDTIADNFGSLGWYGEANFNGTTKKCLLTAGHVARGLEQAKRSIYVTMVEVFNYEWVSNRNYTITDYPKLPINTQVTIVGDYALLAYDGLTQTNNVHMSPSYYEVIELYMDDPYLTMLEGKRVAKANGVSRYKVSTIASSVPSEYPVDSNKVMVTGIVSVNGSDFCEPGDSGCCVFMFDGNAVTTLCGIIASKSDDKPLSYFTPITLPCNDAGFIPYGATGVK